MKRFAHMNTPILILVPRKRDTSQPDSTTIRTDIPPIRVGDPAWVHEAAKAIALSLTEHFETQGA